MPRDHYRANDVPIRGSLERTVAAPATPQAELQRLVDRARKVGVIVFLQSELDRLPDISRALIETEHRRICERR